MILYEPFDKNMMMMKTYRDSATVGLLAKLLFTSMLNQFTSGTLFFFWSLVKNQKQFLAINIFFGQWNEVRTPK